MSLLDDIPEGALVALDTVAWIYEVEAHPVFGPIVRPFFTDRLQAGRNRAGSSLLALGELLVQPLSLGRTDIADRYRSYFTSNAALKVWDVSRATVERAASLRARYRLKMLDALHVAAALTHDADLFVTNDVGIRRVIEIRVLVLSDYVSPTPPDGA